MITATASAAAAAAAAAPLAVSRCRLGEVWKGGPGRGDHAPAGH